jgi:hypothetical protein
MNKFNMDHAIPIDGDEVAERLKGILKATGVKMLITDARVSAIFPDGSVARYQELHMDTEQ